MNKNLGNKKVLYKNLGIALLTYAFSIILGGFITIPCLSGYAGNAVGELILFVIYFVGACFASKKDILKFKAQGFGIGFIISIFLLLRNILVLGVFIYKSNGAPLVTAPALEIFSLVAYSLLVGLSEETLFRGVVQTSLHEYFGEDNSSNVRKAIILASLLFGVVHLSNALGSDTAIEAVLIQIVSAIGGGLLFGTIYYRSNKNIWVPVLIHAFNDFISFIAAGSLAGGTVSDSINNVVTSSSATIGAIAQLVTTLIFLLICLFFTRQKAVKKQFENSNK